MPTLSQIKTIKLGQKLCDLNDAQYRTVLRNIGGVESCKDLSARGYEDVMAFLESIGFDGHSLGPTYWRDKVRRRGHGCPERMAHKIHAFAPDLPYPLAALVRRLSGGRTDVVEELDAHEAYNLIEAAKAIVARRDREGTDTGPARTAGGPV